MIRFSSFAKLGRALRACFSVLGFVLVAATGVQAAYSPDAVLPRDSSVTIDRLPNGITTYVRRNDWPENRVELRLVVLAGSVLEADDQRGLAHFVEHMGFNGSTHFPPGEVQRYFESIGARFGADLNASTSFDQTLYRLDVPATPESLVVRGIQLLSDFAGRITFAPVEVDKERGVVMEEWRGRLGAGDRMLRILYPVLYHGSRYAERLPIGVPEVLQNAPVERLQAYYREWYRPERMAVCVVGSIAPDRAQTLLRESFADIPARTDVATLPKFPVPPHEETLFGIAADPETRTSAVGIYLKHPRVWVRTEADFRGSQIRSHLFAMLNQRFQDLARTPEAPFLSASTGTGILGRDTRTFQLNATVKENGIEGGLRALVLELRRARTHGFSAAELDRVKKESHAQAERAVREDDRTESVRLVAGYLVHYTDSIPILSHKQRLRLLDDVNPTIALTDVQAMLEQLVDHRGRVVLVQTVQKEGVPVPTEAELRLTLEQADATPVSPWLDKVADRPLMQKPPKPGKVRARRQVDPIGVTVLELGNGVEVWLKPTDFKRDEILFSMFTRGGLSTVDPKEYLAATQTQPIMSEAGYGGLTPVEISKLLAGKLVRSTPFIADYSHGIGGSASPEDLETALQLLHLQFTQPNNRGDALQIIVMRLRAVLANRESDPDEAFAEEVAKVRSSDHYMERPIDQATVDKLRFEPALALYRRLFANAADFTVVVTGAFDEATMVPLLERYVASLPSKGKRRSKAVDRGVHFPNGVVTSDVRKGREPKSTTAMHWAASPGRERVERVRLAAAADILNRRLREILREDLGSTYGVSVFYRDLQPTSPYGYVQIGFGGAPENRDRMVEATLREVGRVQAEGPTDDDVGRYKEISRRELEVSEKTNGWWLSQLQQSNVMGWDPAGIATIRERIDAVTKESMKAAFVQYWPESRRSVVSLFPEVTATRDSSATVGSGSER